MFRQCAPPNKYVELCYYGTSKRIIQTIWMHMSGHQPDRADADMHASLHGVLYSLPVSSYTTGLYSPSCSSCSPMSSPVLFLSVKIIYTRCKHTNQNYARYPFYFEQCTLYTAVQIKFNKGILGLMHEDLLYWSLPV